MNHLTTPMQIGGILSARRRALNLSQRELAAKLGISQNRLSELEDRPGKLTVERLLAIFNVLGLELAVSERSPRSKSAKLEW